MSLAQTTLVCKEMGIFFKRTRFTKSSLVKCLKCTKSLLLSCVVLHPTVVNFSRFVFSETDQQNSTKLYMKQVLGRDVFYTKFVLFVPIGKTKMEPLTSDWLRHFRFFLCNRWKEFDEKLNVLYQVYVFRAYHKQRWPPWPLVGWDIFDLSGSPLQPLSGLWRNFTGTSQPPPFHGGFRHCNFSPDIARFEMLDIVWWIH